MIHTLKVKLYFIVAHYFRFWAGIQIRKWNPKIIVITGSSGKTTTMHLLRAQIGDKARYSDKANSSFGIPFDILGLTRKTLFKTEWIGLVLKAPFVAFKKPYATKIYVAEVDCDRPNEGKFLAGLLKPDITIWLSSSETHVMNFDKLVKNGTFNSASEAIAYEFGYLAAATKQQLIINNDNELIQQQLKRSRAKNITKISINDCKSYSVNESGTIFETKDNKYTVPYLLPKLSIYSIEAVRQLSDILSFAFDKSFKNLDLPPSRSSILSGIKSTTIIDSSYNSAYEPLATMIELFDIFPSDNKWIVIGDILEQGSNEKHIHEQIAELIEDKKYKKVILMGPRVSKYTAPILQRTLSANTLSVFENPKDVLDYITANIVGHETILFKGARFLEGVIEHLLLDKNDVKKLCRREAVWEKRRKDWGL